MDYYWGAQAQDPRLALAHECFAHYYQLTSSWAHAGPVRSHFFDSSANEGLAAYTEGLLFYLGLYDASPHTRETYYQWVRLRAVRVQIDIKLALGELSMEQAETLLANSVPIDAGGAKEEIELYTQEPGLALSYLYGKDQIMQFLADARKVEGDKFNLRRFHEFVWRNGNVPATLQRWEYLGLKDQVEVLDQTP